MPALALDRQAGYSERRRASRLKGVNSRREAKAKGAGRAAGLWHPPCQDLERR
jgi:hypothetical protein